MPLLEKKMVCIICSREWKALYPQGAEHLECPGCGYMNALPWEAPPDTDMWKDPE